MRTFGLIPLPHDSLRGSSGGSALPLQVLSPHPFIRFNFAAAASRRNLPEILVPAKTLHALCACAFQCSCFTCIHESHESPSWSRTNRYFSDTSKTSAVLKLLWYPLRIHILTIPFPWLIKESNLLPGRSVLLLLVVPFKAYLLRVCSHLKPHQIVCAGSRQ